MKTKMAVHVGPRLTFSEFTAADFNQRGVYLVYRVNSEDGRFRLIYVGKSDNISDRVTTTHHRYQEWVQWAYGDNANLRFSLVTLQPGDDVERCEAAMIYGLQPPINVACKETFNYDETEIEFEGRKVCGVGGITVSRTA